MKSLDFTVKNYSPGISRQLLCLILGIGFFTMPELSEGVEVDDLYQGTVVVTSRENEQERRRAFTETFRQVLIKVTGNPEVITQSLVRRALANAGDYVDTWSYRATPGNEENSDPGVDLNVSFFEPDVLNLLDTAGIPIWPENRPYTLVWFVIQDELGEREILGTSIDGMTEIRQLLDTEASSRALPWLLPILDIEDRRAVSADDIWNMNAEKLLQASARYQSESVLVIRVFRTLGGEILGKSNYLFREQVHELEAFEVPVSGFIRDSIALAANELSSYYAILISGTDSNIEVSLRVEGVDSAEDYAGLLSYVNELTDVNSYQVASVDNATIQLTLFTGGQLRQLVETIALNRNLLPVSELVRNDNQVHMAYRWNR